MERLAVGGSLASRLAGFDQRRSTALRIAWRTEGLKQSDPPATRITGRSSRSRHALNSLGCAASAARRVAILTARPIRRANETTHVRCSRKRTGPGIEWSTPHRQTFSDLTRITHRLTSRQEGRAGRLSSPPERSLACSLHGRRTAAKMQEKARIRRFAHRRWLRSPRRRKTLAG